MNSDTSLPPPEYAWIAVRKVVGGREGAKRIGGKIKGEANNIHFTSVCTYIKALQNTDM